MRNAVADEPQAFGYRERSWKRFLRGPDQDLLEQLYVPMLAAAVRYDRSCAYFSSSALAAAARGFGRFIGHLLRMGEKAPRPAVRLVVNEEMPAEDVRALVETGDLAVLEKSLLARFKNPKDLLERERLKMLAWLYREGFLDIRVGVMRSGGGIVHGKFGIATDATGESVVFSGSGNESAQGLTANYECLEVSLRSADPERYEHYRKEFEALWADTHAAVHTVTLPEALRLKILKLAPKEAPAREPGDALARQRAAMIWEFVLEAPFLADGGPTCDATALVDLWPHQRTVVEETSSAWPAGRLLCDEVGMGKTIEAILVLRRLLAGRGVKRVLILLPAGLLKQWQAELREKGGLDIPYLEGLTYLVWPGGRRQRVSGLAEALEQDLLLLSRETARTETNREVLLAARPWDLVLLDEAHAARRKEQEEGEFNVGTLLLTLLRELQLRRKTRSLLLLSATPIQTHPWEVWDLLAVLGEGGRWLAEFEEVRNFYDVAASVENGVPEFRKAERAAKLIASDPEFPPPPLDAYQPLGWREIQDLLAFPPPTQRRELSGWLRRGSPLGRRMHRNTRRTLVAYYEMGLLPKRPPQRRVIDCRFDYRSEAERSVYDAITGYIERRFRELEGEKPGKGFVMTIYRRRASSSPRALERSLDRRLEALRRAMRRHALYDYLGAGDIPEGFDPDELPEGEVAPKVPAAVPTNPAAARAEYEEVERLLSRLRSLGNTDSKRDVFFDQLRRLTDDGRSVLVFTEYTDTMEYLRDVLRHHYGEAVGCFSGAGGQMLDGDAWKTVNKAEITAALSEGRLRILICTDAASEGLNLQAAGALINYDLPWNPSKVEQRIGRIDRIGQRHEIVHVVNLFLRDSVDDRVYQTLRRRCGLFQHFVGPMQPVLARARRMLQNREDVDTDELKRAAEEVQADPLAGGAYFEGEAAAPKTPAPAFSRADLEWALGVLPGDAGFRVKREKDSGAWVVSAPRLRRMKFSMDAGVLERDPQALPLTPFQDKLRRLRDRLKTPGECLPLVVGSHSSGGFRAAVAYWIEKRDPVRVKTLAEVREKLEKWDGEVVAPEVWKKVERRAREEAREIVRDLESRAEKRERKALERQLEAARIRLQRELGRFLICLGEGKTDLNRVMYEAMKSDSGTAKRLRECMRRLTGSSDTYPNWPEDLVVELREFLEQLAPSARLARKAGSELDAALRDPRWMAGE